MKKGILLFTCILLCAALFGCAPAPAEPTSPSSAPTSSSVTATSESTAPSQTPLPWEREQAPPYSTLQQVQARLDTAIQSDIWYHQDFSEFSSLAGETGTVIAAASGLYEDTVTYLLFPQELSLPSEALYIVVTSNQYMAGTYIWQLEKRSVSSLQDISMEMEDPDQIMYYYPPFSYRVPNAKEPTYASEDEHDWENGNILKDLQDLLHQKNVTGEVDVYIKGFVEKESGGAYVETDVFVQCANNTVYRGEYSAMYIQYTCDAEDVGGFPYGLEIVDSVQDLAYFQRVKDTTPFVFHVVL